MSEREARLREMRRELLIAVLVATAGELQVIDGHRALGIFLLAVALLSAVSGALSWWLASRAQPWQDADPPKRPPWWLWWPGVFSLAVTPLAALVALTQRHWLDALSWTLWGLAMWVSVAEMRRDRKATAKAKPPVRVGPPQEWL